MEWIKDPMPPVPSAEEQPVVEAVVRNDGYRYSPIAYLGYRVGCTVAGLGEERTEALRHTLVPNGVSPTLQDAYTSGANLVEGSQTVPWPRNTDLAAVGDLSRITSDAFGRVYLGWALDGHDRTDFGVQVRRIYNTVSKNRTSEALLAVGLGELALGATGDAIRHLTDTFSTNLPFTTPPEAAIRSFYITGVNISRRVGFYEALHQQVAQFAAEQWGEGAAIVRQLLRATLQAQAMANDYAASSARDAMWGAVFSHLSAAYSSEARHEHVMMAFTDARECCKQRARIFHEAAQEFLLPLRSSTTLPVPREPTQADHLIASRALQEAGVTAEGIRTRAQGLCGSVLGVFERPGRTPTSPLLWVLPEERQTLPDTLVYMPLGITDTCIYPTGGKERSPGRALVEWMQLGRLVELAGHLVIESDIYDRHQHIRQELEKRKASRDPAKKTE